ncbi:hypothetical protein ABIE56_002180 [Luteibacter sp. 621]|jgi:hypothetical protein|uniref:hypothetical protein n=1 Tax=Luteibacter sp. 621 TaxID=3373916 RepID=UPI003D1D268A
MTNHTAGSVTRTRTRLLGLLVLGAAFMAPLAAQADDHHPPHHVTRHKVCKPHRVYDSHHHYHTVQQCHWVNR